MFSYPKSPIFWEIATKVWKSHQILAQIMEMWRGIKGNIFFSLDTLWVTYWSRGILFFHFTPNGWHNDQGEYFFVIVPLVCKISEKGHIFFFVVGLLLDMKVDLEGEDFFFNMVLIRDFFFNSKNCKSASHTLRSLRSLRTMAGQRPALACASLGKTVNVLRTTTGRRPAVACASLG